MPKAGDEIDGFGGMRLRFERIDDDVLVMEAAYTGEAGMPPTSDGGRGTDADEVGGQARLAHG